MLPIELKGDYDLEVEYTPIKGGNAVEVALPVGLQSCELQLSGGGVNIDGLGDGVRWHKSPGRR